MTTVARCNAAFSGLGAGLVHLSIAAGGEGVPAPVIGVLGAVEILWSVLVLSRGRILLPRTALVVAVAALAAFVLALATGALAEPMPALAAAVLELTATAVVAVSLRSSRTEERTVSPTRALIGLLAGALAVSALATPALAASSGGSGERGGMHSVVDGGHQH
ncbi:hypothetical protein C5D07_05330 [Rathayibacter tritici]|uniref:hypothetical protein n=1 Tax=Rathayibacter tritici TaxID=33888 RepID=UPI000CE72956|nr:hypothetical protein [Rathayibacter tritici]PPF26930.1 hypothetical protein C5C06_10605 [Rathayibacter tritici]PPI16945.1 hypothetical protein C5D07_05330 [Rathayibacter tritici]